MHACIDCSCVHHLILDKLRALLGFLDQVVLKRFFLHGYFSQKSLNQAFFSIYLNIVGPACMHAQGRHSQQPPKNKEKISQQLCKQLSKQFLAPFSFFNPNIP